ncbi:MAG TPA: rhomboid family intramembrane serine protease [Verrucomicrobiae bacterium]|nr:rhomboid family intramembrane serine protease [Verrucomicrobiae bacterium]
MFIILPVGMNYRTERLPIVTFSLIGVNTLVYLVSLFYFFGTQGDSDKWIFEHLWLIPAQSYLWTYLTSMFVHSGFFHLFGNMIFLFLFGCCVEDLIGRWRFLLFYLIGGLVAEFVYIAMSPEHFASTIPMGGASGAISSCMGMYLLLRAGADIEFKYFIWFIVVKAGEFDLPAWVAISFWFLKDLIGAVLAMTEHHSHGGGVAFGAHVGGFLAGLGMIGICKMLERNQAPKDSEEIAAVADVMKMYPRRAEIVTSETPTIYLFEAGVQSGPFALSQIQSMLSLGSISKDALYWSEGMTEWQSVLDLAGGPVR